MAVTDNIERIKKIHVTPRVEALKASMLEEPRFLSVEQARLITQAYKAHEDESVILRRAWGFHASALGIVIRIEKGELIVGNRTAESCAGVVFPESGITWLQKEIDQLPTRPQDTFEVRPEDREYFFSELVPYWTGKTLEDAISVSLPDEIKALEVVGKLNQKDHAQGHICPDVTAWLTQGPQGLRAQAEQRLAALAPDENEKADFYRAAIIVLDASVHLMERYAELAEASASDGCTDFAAIADTCRALSRRPAQTFREALQSLWFLFVLLQMESNASSFSPGRADQYLYPFFRRDLEEKRLTLEEAQELLDALFIKFNQIVYMRKTRDAAFFAGFPIGFNITIGGLRADGSDAVNSLSYLFLHAQEHVRLRQPNLSARLNEKTPDAFVRRVAEVIGIGTGMPQVFCDESVEAALTRAGYSCGESRNYAVVGCVELSIPGNALGFSDSSMFNMVKALELTLNNGCCMLTGKKLGLPLGNLTDFSTYEELEAAYARQLDFFVDRMEQGLSAIEEAHRTHLPSPMLSCVIHDCLEKGVDITRGGAHYNFSGVQLIQVANVADSLAALKTLVFDRHEVKAEDLLDALRHDYPDEKLRLVMLNHAPKYGNDVAWVDETGEKWVDHIRERLCSKTNYRGGRYTIGLYTVSAHVPMGENVAATPDGRRARTPLADGGLSASYGRDQQGPTALLQSVSRIKSADAANGTLLNMKFSPDLFATEEGVDKFCALLRAFVRLRIHHVQFNVVRREDLLAAKANPEQYRHLLVRVAGYTANYVDLAPQLQDEIIARTEYGT